VNEKYLRQIIFPLWGEELQEKLKSTKVLLVGGGALGSFLLQGLVRAGVGFVRVVDRDFSSIDNLHRHAFMEEEEAKSGKIKVKIMEEKARRINTDTKIETCFGDFHYLNALSLAQGVDCIIDATDNLETRYLINEVAIKEGVPWIYGSVVGSQGMSMAILPGESACFSCFLPSPPSPGMLETCERVGIINSVVMIISGIQLTLFYRLIKGEERGGNLFAVDAWEGKFRKIKVKRGEECPACQKKEFTFLQGRFSTLTTLCGRNAVQVVFPEQQKFDLDIYKNKLKRRGKLEERGGYLVWEIEGNIFYLFPDARVMVKGTEDKVKARNLISRYLGI